MPPRCCARRPASPTASAPLVRRLRPDAARIAEHIDAATQRQIGNNLDLARQLGGTSLPFKGTDLVSTIAAFVKEYGITHIVMGRTGGPGIVVGSARRFWTACCRHTRR